MELRLGSHGFDVSTQAIVIADSIGDCTDAWIDSQRDLGAAAIRVTGPAIPIATDMPVIAATCSADDAAAWLRAGASAIDGGLLADPGLLPVIVDANASVIISDPSGRKQALFERAMWAETLGLPKSQIIIEVTPEQVPTMVEYHYPVSIKTNADQPGAHGAEVSAVMAGARLVHSNDVRATKRTLSTVHELLQRRGVFAPEPVEYRFQ